MYKSDAFLRYARHCVELADNANSAEERLRLLEMAQAWKHVTTQAGGIADLVREAQDRGIIPLKSKMN
jgi:uncharacterized protein with PhoU and TrkA domain